MKVFLKKDVEKIGLAGEIIKVKEGFARNFLLPQGLGVVVDVGNEKFFKTRERSLENRKEVLATQTSMLAEKIQGLSVSLKKKMHNDGKLYGALGAGEIAEKLAEKGFSVSKSQIVFTKSIKSQGTYDVVIKLSSRLQPTVKVTIIPE